MLETVNVVEQTSEYNMSIRSFPETPEGNKQAEELFRNCLEDNEVPAEDIDSYIEDGLWENGEYKIFLCHSWGSKATPWEDNSIQFPRLLAEIQANIEMSDKDFEDMCDSMDLTEDAVNEIFDRAQEEWERIKGNA
jgi:hypothetical protein